MKKHFEILTEGVTLTAIETNKSKYDLLTVNFFMPLSEENAAKSAVLASVLNRGTVKYPTMRELSIAEEELYAASTEAYTRNMGENICLTFSASGINKAYTMGNEDIWDKLLQLVNQLIFHPLVKDGGFTPEYVESEKKNQLDIIKARFDNKSSYAVSRCIEIMCKNEKYSISADGREDQVKKINGRGLYEFFNYVTLTCPVHAVYSGNESGSVIAEKIRKNLPFSGRNAKLPETEIVKSANRVLYTSEKMDMHQSKLCIGYRTGVTLKDEDWLKFLVFNEIFASSPTSKLFMNVREKMSLCYYCSPIPQAAKGLLIITAGINAADRDSAYNAIKAQLEDMKNGCFTDDELNTAIRSLKSSFRSVTDSVRSLNKFFLSRFVSGIDMTPVQGEEKTAVVSRSDVVNIAKLLSEDTVYFLEGDDGK